MSSQESFDIDLKLPQTPPIETGELHNQLQYIYKALRILADRTYPKAETPATASSPGIAGSLAYDTSYLYICVSTNTWRRIAHASF